MSVTDNTQLWDVLYSWASSVLNGVEVTESHENAPTPSGNFVCIDYAGSWRLAGTTASRMNVNDTEHVAPRIYVYKGEIEIRDVDGNGDNLMKLVESLETQAVLDLFADAGLSVLKTNGPNDLPALQQTKWRRESVLTLETTWARGYGGSELTIESVEISHVEVDCIIDSENEIIVDNERKVLLSEENLNTFTIEQ